MKRIIILIGLLAAANIVAAQNAQKEYKLVWNEPYDFAVGVSYGYSDISRSAIGIDLKCRWVGLGAELSTGIHPINYTYPEVLTEQIINANPLARIDNVEIQEFSRYSFMLYVNAHLRYFSIGIGWGLNDWGWVENYDVELLSVQTRGASYVYREPSYWVRPYIEGHLPIFNNKLILSPKIGAGISLTKDPDGMHRDVCMYYGIGILKTLTFNKKHIEQ